MVSMRVHSYADDVFRRKSNTSLLFTQCIIDAADSTTGASISFVEARAGTGEHLTGINRCLPADHSGVWHLPVLQRPSYGAPALKDEDGIPAWLLVQSSCQPSPYRCAQIHVRYLLWSQPVSAVQGLYGSHSLILLWLLQLQCHLAVPLGWAWCAAGHSAYTEGNCHVLLGEFYPSALPTQRIRKFIC